MSSVRECSDIRYLDAQEWREGQTKYMRVSDTAEVSILDFLTEFREELS